MRIGSVCSGIGCEAVAWSVIPGWEHVFFSETAAFPRAVLKHRFPEVPLHGDFTTIQRDTFGPIDLLVGGTPCQSFSVAGSRGGVDDHRGDLAFEFLALARRTRPQWIVFENVPGFLSIDSGRSFGAFLGAMANLGYGIAYRILDAQWCRIDGFPRAVPQRRRRLFVVGYLGDWRPAAAVLLERQSLQGHPPPRRTAGQGAPTIPARSTAGGGLGTDFDLDGGLITGPLTSCGDTERKHGHGWGQQEYENGFIVPTQTFGGVADPICANEAHAPAVALCEGAHGVTEMDIATSVQSGGGKPGQGYQAVAHAAAVRRLTPRECERLQGLPDDWTLIPWRGGLAADGPRYKAIGNGQAVNVMRWIGRRIEAVEAILGTVKGQEMTS